MKSNIVLIIIFSFFAIFDAYMGAMFFSGMMTILACQEVGSLIGALVYRPSR